jgi:hypothetical protein
MTMNRKRTVTVACMMALAWCLTVPAPAQEIDLTGNTGWQRWGARRMRIFADRVDNLRDRGASGWLRLQIWATTNTPSGGTFNGFVIGHLDLGPLDAGYSFIDIDNRVRFYAPPPGIYGTTIALEEYVAEGGYVTADWEDFAGLVNFGGVGQGETVSSSTNEVRLSGAVEWLSRSGRVNLFANEILNTRETRTGSLRLRLWATGEPYAGGLLNGYVLATKPIGRLKPLSYLPNLSRTAAFRPPPEETYHTTLTLEEHTRYGWFIVDFVTFPGTSLF